MESLRHEQYEHFLSDCLKCGLLQTLESDEHGLQVELFPEVLRKLHKETDQQNVFTEVIHYLAKYLGVFLRKNNAVFCSRSDSRIFMGRLLLHTIFDEIHTAFSDKSGELPEPRKIIETVEALACER